MNFQDMIATLTRFWAEKGCLVHQGYDLEVGAGTFNPATFLRCLGPEPYAAVYVEPSRRPKDGRYGENPNRVQFYHQMQVIIKPSPPDIQDLYLESLKSIGLDLSLHDIRFVHDDWENPTIGAWGLGWEVWADGMEVTQFTYFQAVGGLPVKPVSGEITYGLERLALYIQGVDSFFDLKVNDQITYGDIYKRSEWEWSHYNFHEADDKMWLRHFEDFEKEALRLMKQGFPIPAYDFVMKCSHAFNILDARGVISVTERTAYMGRIRALARQLAEHYVKSREEQSFPLLRFHEEKKIHAVQTPVSTISNPDERQDFLLEIGSEELPATFVPLGMQSLERLIHDFLKTSGLKHGEIKVFGTPRRLAVLVKDLAGGTEAFSTERKGPSLDSAFQPDGTSTKAGSGFFQSIGCGNPARDQIEKGEIPGLEIRQIKEVAYLYAHIETSGQSTRALLATELPKIILNIDFPKKMRWGSLDIEYARPLRWIVALYGNEIIPFALGSLLSGRETHGHRQLSPNILSLKHANEWQETLKKNWVMADVAERKELISNELNKIETKLNAEAASKEKVMAQVLHLVEWPFLTTAPFEERFLKAPKEVLISEMVEHQKYFPLASKEGALIPHFVIVCNNKPTDLIRKGNQKALFPRLTDGMFLYEADLKEPLEHFNEKLKTVTYQKELGSVFAKVERMSCIATYLHSMLPIAPLEKIKRAVLLSKADLASELVGEFPELQGIIGRLYATHHGEDQEIASAIDEQWMPRGEKAPLPKTPTGILLSLTEKMDNIFGCFALDLKPSSSSDPYALRRQAFGMLKLCIEHKYHLPLMDVFKETARCFLESKEISTKASTHIRAELNSILNEIEAFLLNRLRTVLSDYGFEKEEIEAVLSNKLSDVYEKWCKLSELRDFRKKHPVPFSQLMETYTRVRKILLSQKNLPKANAEAFKAPEERALFESLRNNMNLQELSELYQPVSALFDAVKIMDDDEKIKANRLALLHEVLIRFENFADFSKINIS